MSNLEIRKKKRHSLYFCNGYLDVCLMFYEHIYKPFWRKAMINLSSAPNTQNYFKLGPSHRLFFVHT